VVDGSDPAPQAQIAAVREVLGEIGAGGVDEIIVINKADAASPDEIDWLRRREPGAVVASARTGDGIDDLLRVIEDRLPGADVEVEALIPFARGDLVSRVHREGTVLAESHDVRGTALKARVPPDLRGVLEAAGCLPGAE
jgi:GTP-binding protein HflX